MRWGSSAATAVVLVELAAVLACEWLPDAVRCAGGTCSKVGRGWLDPFFVWDGVWYQGIAAQGYVWNAHRTGFQNPAFWPLWPLLLRGVAAVTPNAATDRLLTLCLVVVIAITSGLVFHELATTSLSRRSARRATILYLVFPGMHFLLRSYPSGLLNIGVCLVLLGVMRKRFWLAGLVSGVSMAAGPLAISGAMAIGVGALAGSWRWLFGAGATAMTRLTGFGRLAALGLLSLAGMLGFMLFLRFRFGDAFLFVAAERAWGVYPPVMTRLGRLLSLATLVPECRAILRHIHGLLTDINSVALNENVQARLGALGLGTALASLYAGWRGLPWIVLVQSGAAVGLYVWFIVTVQGNEATFRLLYVAPGCFLALAWLLRRTNIAFWSVAATSFAVLIAETMVSGAGFRVF